MRPSLNISLTNDGIYVKIWTTRKISNSENVLKFDVLSHFFRRGNTLKMRIDYIHILLQDFEYFTSSLKIKEMSVKYTQMFCTLLGYSGRS